MFFIFIYFVGDIQAAFTIQYEWPIVVFIFMAWGYGFFKRARAKSFGQRVKINY